MKRLHSSETVSSNGDGQRDAPIFVVGANRSGTTVLRLVLNAHSRIAIPEELTYFNDQLAGVPLQTWRAPALTLDQYRLFVRDFVRRHAESLAPLRPDELAAEVLAFEKLDLRHPYQAVLQAWARCQGKVRWGEKTPGNLFYADILIEMFPNARFIYLMRDPRAGVASMMRAPMFAADPVINALNRHKYATQGLALLERAVPAGQRTTVRYEDLVTSPEATVRALCAFLQEPFEPAMLTFYKDAAQYMTPSAATGFNRAATQPIHARTDAWREVLAPEAIAIVERICTVEMERFGYAPEAPAHTTWHQHLDLAVKRAYFRLQHWRHPHAPQYILKHRLFDRSRRRLRRAGRHLAPWNPRVPEGSA